MNLSWDAPTLDSDGAALTDLSGYRVYHGANPGAYTSMIEVDGSSTETAVALEPGTYYFSVTAFDDDFNESDFSEELKVTVTESGASEG